MIKKSVFENELIAGMQHQLRKQASGETPDLVKAGECLHAALEILEEAGFHRHADKVLGILHKIATDSPKRVEKMLSMQELMRHGLTTKDLQEFGQGHHGAKAKMNRALRKMNLTPAEMADFIGPHNVMTDADLDQFERFNRWMQNPQEMDLGPAQPGQVVNMESVPQLPEDTEEDPDKHLSFQSIAGRTPKRPDTVSDRHIKNLTPSKMVANLKNHGTEFNMADLNWSDFDPELADVLDANSPDELNIDDILDADVTDEILEVNDLEPLEDFEDEVSPLK